MSHLRAFHGGLCLAAAALGLAGALATDAGAEDWPTFQHDNRRTAFTKEKIAADNLALEWTWQAPLPPQPAWAGPAKWDSYAVIRNLPSMRSYDLVFHTIAVGDSVYFGSSSDHSIHCLAAESGDEKWSFTTDAPIRIAPSYFDGKLYFGSDDGAAYCIDASEGQLIWKFRPQPTTRKFFNNGALISPLPCRTGVMVDQGIAYFGHALLPWHDSYLCAVDAKTGQPSGKSCYVHKLSNLTLEGAPALSSQWVVFPQGRVSPRIFQRADGKDLGAMKKSGGGSIVVVTFDSKLLHGPAVDSRRGNLRSSDPKTLEMVAAFGRGNALAVADNISYMLTDSFLIASDMAARKKLWQVACQYPHALIRAGDILFVGGEDEVAAFHSSDGRRLWRHAVEGKALGLAAANGRLLVSTDTGAIYAFRSGAHAKTASAEVQQPFNEKAARSPEAAKPPKPHRLAAGPWLQFTAPGEGVIRWRTESPSPTLLEYWLGETRTKIEDARPKTEHEVHLKDLKRNRTYTYQIRVARGDETLRSAEFECDTFFNYHLPHVASEADFSIPDANGKPATIARRLLDQAASDQGVCLLFGVGDGRLAYHLAANSRLRVIAVETDAEKVKSARATLKASGLYGQRAAVLHVESLSELPCVGRFANLVVCQNLNSHSQPKKLAAEINRVLRPDGGIALLGIFEKTLDQTSQDKLLASIAASSASGSIEQQGDGPWIRLVGKPLPGAGDWSHLYGRTDNSAFAGEELGDARTVDDLEIQWIGRPGPRYQSDRSGRKPSPLSTGSRLFLQGLDRIVALDVYNGSILWSLEVPGFLRFNVPRDSSNWCAGREHLYALVNDKCWRIDAATGEVLKIIDVVGPDLKNSKFEWGFIATVGGQLIGSSVRQGASWLDFWGKAGWYDHRSGPLTNKVCSDNIFSVDPQTGETNWTYDSGVVMNPSITIAGDRIYFIENRDPKIKDQANRRLGGPEFWKNQYLVALDRKTGSVAWERPIDTEDGDVAFYMAHGKDRLVIVSSRDKKYFLYAFSAKNGDPLWDQQFTWAHGKGDHGKAMSRPAIVGETLYVKPRAMSLADGKLLDIQMPDGKCGTYACSTNALFFRTRTVSMWDRKTATTTDFPRLRPDCWLSTIPAAGMLLSPEGGGGCSCGSWMETSIGFMPKVKVLATAEQP